jgi:hypothetical protein
VEHAAQGGCMFSTGRFRRFVPAVSLFISAVAGSPFVRAQSVTELRSSARSSQHCLDADLIQSGRGQGKRFDESFASSETLSPSPSCDDRGAADAPAALYSGDDPPIVTRHVDQPEGTEIALRSPIPSSIRASGREAEAIFRASTAALAILRSNNSCSAWFAKFDPNIAETFSSLQFWIERNGPGHIVQERGERGDWIEHGPYIARTSQRTGSGTNIAINANGAFFRAQAEVYKIKWQGASELPTNTKQILHVGPFDGATTQAQIITLLHELAHVVGAIPSDGLSPAGLNRSQENTDLILKYCKSAANENANRPAIQLAQKLLNSR